MLLEAVSDIDKGLLHERLLLNRGECRERAGGESVDRGWLMLIGSGRAVFRVVRNSVESH